PEAVRAVEGESGPRRREGQGPQRRDLADPRPRRSVGRAKERAVDLFGPAVTRVEEEEPDDRPRRTVRSADLQRPVPPAVTRRGDEAAVARAGAPASGDPARRGVDEEQIVDLPVQRKVDGLEDRLRWRMPDGRRTGCPP